MSYDAASPVDGDLLRLPTYGLDSRGSLADRSRRAEETRQPSVAAAQALSAAPVGAPFEQVAARAVNSVQTVLLAFGSTRVPLLAVNGTLGRTWPVIDDTPRLTAE